jgi:soluble lytic murein transglycosylase
VPRVPEYSNLQTSIAPESGARAETPGGPAAGAIAAAQASNFGRAATDAGTASLKIATEMAEQANQVRVNDAINRVRMEAQDLAYNPETGYAQRKGSSAFLDATGKPLETPLPQEYGSKLTQAIGEVASTLGNDRQKELFSMHAGDISAQFHGQVEHHLLGQFNAYKDATDDATVKLAGQTAALSWNDPNVLFGKPDADGVRAGGAIDQARAAIYSKAKRAGLTGTAYDEAVLAGVSAIHTNVVKAALENGNTEYALGYLDKARKAGQMSGTDILAMQGHLNTAVNLQLATGAVQQATQATVPKLAPTGFDRMLSITVQSESGGDPNAVSPKGAKGLMQVMDATNGKPGFGVKPAADDSPAERTRVGRDYLQAMIQKYGDPAKAWAAYNAGPGRLDEAITRAAARPGGDWLTFMPAETQAYVQKNMAQLQSGTQAAARPTELDFINDAVARLPAGTPVQAVQKTRELAKSQYEVLHKSMGEMGDAATADAQRWILQNKGASVDQLPPDLRDRVARYAPGKMDDLKTFSANLAKGDVTTNLAVYQKLSDPQDLRTLSDNQFYAMRTQLSEPDFKHFAAERAKLTSGAGGNGPGELNTAAIKSTLDARLRELKIDPSPKDDGGNDAARIGTIRRFVDEQLGMMQRDAGKKFNDVETAKAIDGLFSTRAELKGWTGAYSAPALSAKPGDIPSATRDAIKASFKKSGVDDPTDAQVLNAYLHWNQLQASKKAATVAKK